MSEIKWLVRAGEEGYLINEFARGFIAIGWHALGALSPATSEEEIRDRYICTYPDESPSRVGNAIAMICKFRFTLGMNQKIVTYDRQQREYLIGAITSDYYHDVNKISEAISDYPHFRDVNWQGRVSRDVLSAASKYSLGSSLTLFSANEEVSTELLSHVGAPATPENSDVDDD